MANPEGVSPTEKGKAMNRPVTVSVAMDITLSQWHQRTGSSQI